MESIYLDNASTTKPKVEVVDAMLPYLTNKYHNPSSLYSPSVQIKKDIENARKTVADFIGAQDNEIYFTSSGSESNCWAIKGFCERCLKNDEIPMIVTTPIEHKSIISCVENHEFVNCEYVEIDKDGMVDIDDLERILECYSKRKYTKYNILVSIQIANNEIGTIQKVGKISHIVHEYNAILHMDAVQAFGQISIRVDNMGIDMLSASGHKIGCPKGIGILYKKKDIEIEPLIYGSQMDGMRGGTENVSYIVGFSKAVELKKHYVENGSLLIEVVQNEFIKKLESIGCKLIGHRHCRLSNNINVMLPKGVGAEEMLYMLDMAGIYISTGSACNSHSVEPSYVLKAIGLTDEEAARCIRITLPDYFDCGIIDKVICEIEKNIKLL